MEFVTSARLEKGKVHIRNRRVFDEVMGSWRDCELTITIERKHATRSNKANKYWWGVCVALVSEHTGYTPEEIHEIAKHMFLPKHLAVTGRNGEMLGDFVVGGTTSTLNAIEFGEFVSKFKQWAWEKLGVEIPEADPDYAEKRPA